MDRQTDRERRGAHCAAAPTFVQLAVDVLGQLGAGLQVGGIDVERLAVRSSPLPLLHGLSAHAQYGAPEVLDLGVLHHLKLTHRHPDGEACKTGTLSARSSTRPI